MKPTASPIQPCRIGMISFAHGHAYTYAACLNQLSDAKLIGIYDDNAERGKDAADQMQTTYHSHIDNLLALDLDGVIICSENALHRTHVEQTAPHVRHILCEKPIATTLEDAHQMIALCAAHNTQLQIAFPVRFSPPIQQLKDTLQRGDLGQIYSAKCTNHGTMPGGWFTQLEKSGGGAVLDHTVHVIDLLRWSLQTEVTEVYAEVGTGLLYPECAIDDAGLLSFQLANGVYGTLDTSWSRPQSYPSWGDVKVEVIGEHGAIAVDTFRQQLTVSSDKWNQTRWVPWGSDMNRGLIQDFVEMIQHQRAPTISGQDGIKALEVALVAYQSAATGQPIQL